MQMKQPPSPGRRKEDKKITSEREFEIRMFNIPARGTAAA
jgi:hypothetical protein